MSKIIGKIYLQNSNYSFHVKWDKDRQLSWLGIKPQLSSSLSWVEVGSKVLNEKDALSIAQKHIDYQYGNRWFE